MFSETQAIESEPTMSGFHASGLLDAKPLPLAQNPM